MRRRYGGFALVLALVIGSIVVGSPSAGAQESAPAVVPRLTQWDGLGGTVSLRADARILVAPGDGERTAAPAGRADLPGPVRQTVHELAVALRDEIERVTGIRPVVTSGRARPGDVALALADDETLGAEGYRLDSDRHLAITAASTHGLYYGTRTLLQSLRADRAFPRGHATDRPAQPVRMVQLDAGRKYWQLDYLENLIRRMGDLKLNTLFLHLSDSEGFRLDSTEFPGLADPANSYSRADIERLKAFAARHHVQLMPGLDVPGHATVISDAFGIGFGDGPNPCEQRHTHSHLTPDWIVDITSPRAVAVTEEIVGEFADWFDAPLFSVGADELPGQLASCPRVVDRLAADPTVTTMGDLLNGYINRLDDVISASGKRTAIYNGSEHLAAPQQQVHPSVVFLTWEGTGAEPVIPGHDEIAIGPFYNTPNNYHSLYLDEPWMYDTWAPSTAPDMLGSGVMNWADYNFWAEDAYFEQHVAPGRAVFADRAWNASATPDTVAEFRARWRAVGDPPEVREPAPPSRVDDGKPGHHWTLDPADYPSGWTWAGSPGNTIMAEDVAGDLSGTSYIINNPTPVDGVRGTAWRFDNGRDGIGFGGLDVAPPWTAALWVRRNAVTTDGPLWTSKAGALKLDQYGTCGEVGFTRNGVADHSFGYRAPVGEWVHLTFVARPDRTTLYVNGVAAGTVDTAIPLPLRSIGDVRRAPMADLDELVTYDEALSASQVASRYAAYGVAGSDRQEPCRTSVAVGKPATQSSTAYNGVAARAVDGRTDGSFGAGSVTHTAEDGTAEPWWQVDLGTSVAVDEIAVWNRTDCCASRLSDYYVLTSDRPFTSASLAETLARPDVRAYHQPATAGTPTRVAVGAPARYVRVQTRGTAPLSIAEVQVFTLGGSHA